MSPAVRCRPLSGTTLLRRHAAAARIVRSCRRLRRLRPRWLLALLSPRSRLQFRYMAEHLPLTPGLWTSMGSRCGSLESKERVVPVRCATSIACFDAATSSAFPLHNKQVLIAAAYRDMIYRPWFCSMAADARVG